MGEVSQSVHQHVQGQGVAHTLRVELVPVQWSGTKTPTLRRLGVASYTTQNMLKMSDSQFHESKVCFKVIHIFLRLVCVCVCVQFVDRDIIAMILGTSDHHRITWNLT